jgi:hypothetical protein
VAFSQGWGFRWIYHGFTMIYHDLPTMIYHGRMKIGKIPRAHKEWRFLWPFNAAASTEKRCV